MKKILLIILAAIAAAAVSAASAAENTAKVSRPNIVFILADDLGLDGVGCYGSDKHKTPNIDRLAESGLRFETCYAAPLCGPSRCLLMTGRYAFRTGGIRTIRGAPAGPARKSDRRTPDGAAAETGRLRHRHGRQVAAGRRDAAATGASTNT